MRVLAVTPTFFPIVGGAELLVRDVLNVWAEEHEVRLLTPYLPAESEAFWADAGELEASCGFAVDRFEDRANLLRLRGHRITRGVIPPMSLSAVAELSRRIEAHRPDLLVGFFGVPFGLSLAIVSSRSEVPYALVFCGNDIPSPRTVPVPLWRGWMRTAALRAWRAVYVSRFCFDALWEPSGFAPPHDVVIHGGIPLAEDRVPGDRDVLRAGLGFGPDDIMLFTLSRLGPEKRVDVVVRAYAALPPLPRRVRLVIGGQGPEAEPLRRLAEDLGVADDVVFAGHLGEEKSDYYEACDVFVFHSLFETFGQVLVEAMSAGKPVVSVRAGAIPEVVEDGVTGLLAQPEDELGLAECVAEVVRDDALRRSMGAAARRRVERLFDWEVVRRQWRDLLAETPAVPHRAALASAAGAREGGDLS